jgi:trehalose 6-phosphate phosphatase
MEHLLTAWPKIKESLEERSVLLVLDFDGTIAPIVRRPSDAFLPPKTRDLLRRLSKMDWCSLAIVSGRTLRSLKGKVRIDGIIYGGNHGARLSGPGIDFQAPLAETTHVMQTIAPRLGVLRSSIKGVIIENKKESLSVHYRAVAEGKAVGIPELVAATIKPFLATGLINVRAGKKVIDITPSSWDKGKAVMWLLDRMRSLDPGNRTVLPICVGDDTTDEDAFAAIGADGLTVVVGGDAPSRAVYYLKDTSEVHKFLVYLLVDGCALTRLMRGELEHLKD